METNNELKENYIKNSICGYFDDIININDLDLDNILLNEKTRENNLIYSVAYKTPYDAKPSRITFDKVGGYIREQDRTKCLGLFDNFFRTFLF